MSFVYWLSLDNGKFYVGRTSDIKRRIGEHFLGEGSKWTKLNKPKEVIGYTKELEDNHEDYITLLMMKKHGVDNVRGGKWCMQFLSIQLKGNLNTICSYINESISIKENMNRIDNIKINYIINVLSLNGINKNNFGNDGQLWNELISIKKCIKCKQTYNIIYMKPYCYSCWEKEYNNLKR